MSSKNKMSYSQAKRSTMDYRKEYFKKNKGYFGGRVYKCAYCQKLLIGKQNVEVDHIMPLNNVFGRNATYNLVGACRECNRKKSDSVDYRVPVGYASKITDTVGYTIQKLAALVFVTAWQIVWACFKGILGIFLWPFKSDSLYVKVIAGLIYAVVIYSMIFS